MDTSNGGSKNSAGFDPLDVDPLGAIDDNVVLSSNGNGDTVVDIKPNFIDDFESQIDSLVVNTPPAVKTESPALENSPVKTKGKRTYKKKRSKVNADSEDSTDDEDSEFESKRFKKETSSNNSINSNEDSDAALSSARSRRSSRKSRPNNFYTKNYELESGSGSDNDKKSRGKKNFDEEEYTPVKEKKIKTPKSNAGRKKKNLEESMAEETPTITTTETVLNFSNETPFVDPPVLIPNSTDVSANELDVSNSANNVTPVILDVSFADPDEIITAELTDNTLTVADKPPAPKTNSTNFSTLKKSGVSVRPVEVSNLTEIKIASVSSMADMTPASSKSNPISNIFKETQSHKACNFIKDALTTTAELGNLLNSKANEFVEKKATDSFMTDTRKLQFCMEKAFVLFNLARNNLSGIEKKLKSEYADFMIKNRYDRLLKCDKNTNAFLRKYDMTLDALEVKSCPGAVDSDSDCEIVEVASAPGPARPIPAGRGRPGQKQRPAELDILRRVERNGISWKAKKTAGGGAGSVSSDGEGVQKVQLPGKNPVWINKNICVKKVTPAKNSNRSFFREDGRTLKPPDPPGTTPFSKSGKPTALSTARPVGKTALVLCWLDLAHRQTDNNFFSTLKEMEKPKRNDSCSDLGESCSDDEDIPAVVSENFLTAISEDFLTVCRNDSLLKLCINRMNSIFLARTQNLLDKFNFHLFDDLPEPNDYSEDDEEVIRTIISTSKDIVNTNTPSKLSKDGISDDPMTGSLPVPSKETPAANQLAVGSYEAPTDPQIVTGDQPGPTSKSEIDATIQLQTIDAVADISGHLQTFEESIITKALHLPSTPEHKIVDAFNQLSEQENTDASKDISNIEEAITDTTFDLSTAEKAITEASINLPTAERPVTDASINLSSAEKAIIEASINLPTAEQAITDSSNNLPPTEQAIADTTTVQATAEASITLPTTEQAITTINLPLTAERTITDVIINLPTTEQAIFDATTEQSITNASINLPTTEQAITDTVLDFPTAEQAITDDSINLPSAEHAIIDTLINFSTLEEKCNDNSVDLLTGKPVTITSVLSPSASSIDPEKDAFSNTKSTDDIIEKDVSFSKTPAINQPITDAFKYLLASSSNSDSSGTSVRIQKKKKYTKRVKKISHGSSDENGSIKVTDSSDNEFDESFSKFKDDPKFYYKTTVNVVPLSARQLKPFQKILEELAKDLEIEKLVDFSSLIRHTRPGSQKEQPKTKTKEVIKNKKPPVEPLPEKNLFNLLTSDLPKEDTLDETLLDMKPKEKAVEKSEELIDELVHRFQLKNNSMVKNFLLDSSSSSDSDIPKKQSSKTEQKEFLLLHSSESSDSAPKKSDLEEDQPANKPDDVQIELKTPVKKSIQKVAVHKSADKLLSGIDSLLREEAKRKKKVKSGPEEEENLWLKKKDRILSSEKKKNLTKTYSSGSDKDSEDSDTSLGSADSQILQTPRKSPRISQQNSSDNSVEPSSEQSTPITPKTKNIIAHSNLLSDSSNADSDDSADSITSSDLSVTEVNETATPLEAETPTKGRKNIRKVIRDDSLMDTTILAAKEEEERMRRLNEKQSQLTELISLLSPKKAESVGGPSLVLDFDIESKTPLVTVHPALVKILKPHQIDGVKFMWDTCFESVQMVCDGKAGAGCILAHCMGLGKSLQVVTLVHTVLNSALLSTRTVLICCPLSTVLNWADEFNKWLRKTGVPNSIKVFELSKFKKNYERGFHLEDWHKTGGVFIIGYEMFRLLTTMKEGPDVKPHVIKKIYTTLLNPGPDLIVCDEGHLLKNDNTALAKVMNKIHTKRRIVLTGTPLQNNLKEYYCMVNFVKPNLLGSRREYFNRFENPISNGQHRDSSIHDINIMKKRSHVLHKMLEGSVQRKEATILYKYLPRKLEYVLLTTLTKCQVDIYQHYLERYSRSLSSKGTGLLKDFHILQKVWTHPRTLQQFLLKSRQKKLNSDKVKTKKKSYVKRMIATGGFVCLEDDGAIEEETLASPDDTDWWMSYLDNAALENLETSPKFSVAFKLLDESLQAGDKMLIFCTSLFTLDALEYFLKKDKGWKIGHHYYRLDGSVTLENRQNWCRQFNSERNKEVKLFLISTRAGGLGINMIAANRVIIMDVSWNPSHDVQSIFRVYRFGQKKDCFIYRLVSLGTMEEKIYERSVTKQAVACRVVDEQQVDRHYNMAELNELYFFNPVPNGPQPIPSFPSDHVLARVLATTRLENKKRNSENFKATGPAAAEVTIVDKVATEHDNNPINCIDNTKMSKDDSLAPVNPTNSLDKNKPSTNDNQETKNTEKISSSIVMLTNRSASDSQINISNSPEKIISSSMVMLTNRASSDSQVNGLNSPERVSSSIVMLTNQASSESNVTKSTDKVSSSIVMLTNQASSNSQVTKNNENISSSIVMLTNKASSDSQVTGLTSPERVSSSIVMLTNKSSSDSQVTQNTERISSSMVILDKQSSGDKVKAAAGGDGTCLPYVWSMHEHDSLLKDLYEEQLDEDDRKLAWLEYEAEREQQRVVKANGEMIVPDLKMSKKNYKMPPNVFPTRLIPISNHGMTNHFGGSILPDLGSDSVFKPRPFFDRSRFTNPNFRYPRVNPGSGHRAAHPSVRQPYAVGRYGLPDQIRPTLMAENAFQNILISNITSANSSHSANPDQKKKRKKKVPRYFPTDKASTTNGLVMDLTSLPDTPDKDKPPGRRRSSSAKKSSKRTPGKTPKKATPRRSSDDKKSSLENRKRNSTKKLDFDEDSDCVISGESSTRCGHSLLRDTLLEQCEEPTPVFTIELLD